MNAAFGPGSYSLLIGGQSFSLNLPTGNGGNNFLFPNAPIITATNATWLPDGTLFYDERNGPLTLATNNFATNASTPGHLGISLSPTNGQPNNFPDFDTQTFSSGTASISQMYLDPSEFVAGTTYQVEVEFDNIVAGPTALGGTLGSAMAVSTYNARTTFDLAVIPEPSAYAVLAGVAVLAMAAMRRRARRQAW